VPSDSLQNRQVVRPGEDAFLEAGRSIVETIDYSGIICGGAAARPDRFPGRGQWWEVEDWRDKPWA
jgi:hypothetical protein